MRLVTSIDGVLLVAYISVVYGVTLYMSVSTPASVVVFSCAFAAAVAVWDAMFGALKIHRTLTSAGVDGNEVAIVDADPGNRSLVGLPREAGFASNPEHAMSAHSRPHKPANVTYPPPFPNGWYVLIPSADLPAGKPTYLKVLGLHIALYRAQDTGVPYATDAFCPHNGANLAVGGTVEGSCLRCPFHGWSFDAAADGKCVDIPYASAPPPPSAVVTTYTLREVNGLVLLWYHCDGVDPEWEVPSIVPPSHTRVAVATHHVAAHIVELPENGSDISHFTSLHGRNVVGSLDRMGVNHEWDVKWEPAGHTFNLEVNQWMAWKGKLSLPFTTTRTHITQHGPGMSLFTFSTAFGHMTIVEAVTPLEPLLQRVHHVIFAGPTVPSIAAKGVFMGVITQYERDALVFNNKRYTNKPMLVKEDAAISQFRKWFKQFYTDNSKSMRQAAQACNPWDW